MRTFLSLALLVGGLALCLLDELTYQFVRASTTKAYKEQLAAMPYKETYTRDEYMPVVWKLWTNRVALPPKTTYTVEELQDNLFGAGRPCDRLRLETLIERASGYQRSGGLGTTLPGVIAMLIGAYMIGGVMSPQDQRNRS